MEPGETTRLHPKGGNKMKEWAITYYNKWEAEYGCKHATIIGCEWIYTDKEMLIFQKWYDKRGKRC